MKILKKFILRKIAGEQVLVPIGETTSEFNGLITMNDVAAFLWKNLERVNDPEEFIPMLLDEYEVDEELARKDAYEFVEELRAAGFIE